MRRFFIPAAAAVVAAFAAFVIAVALPAGAATHPSVKVHQPALCRVLQHARTDGTHSLRFYARKMDAHPAQLLFLSGFCATSRTLNHTRASVLRYHDFSRPFPAGFTLYGPL